MTDDEIKKRVEESIRKGYIAGSVAGCMAALKLMRGSSKMGALGLYAGSVLLNKIAKKYPTDMDATAGPISRSKKLIDFLKTL